MHAKTDREEQHPATVKSPQRTSFFRSKYFRTLVIAVVTSLLLAALWNYASPVSLYTAVQCLWKSYHPVDNYRKSAKAYHTVTDVFREHKGGGFGSSTLPTDKATDHEYNKVYDIILPSYNNVTEFGRNNNHHNSDNNVSAGGGGISLIEIGVKKGGSLKLFREFFERHVRIVGADIDPAISTFPRESGIKTLVLDSTETDQVDGAFGPGDDPQRERFAIVIDDGCHRLSCIQATFESFWGRLDPRGVYVVEDFPPYYSEMGGGFAPHELFAGEGRRICMRKDQGTHGIEFIVVIYPTGSRAPLLPGCVDRMS